jgi:hypothetical protein
VLARLFAILGLLIGLFALTVDWVGMLPIMVVSETNAVARSFPDFFIYYWTFFTHLTNFGLVLTYFAYLSGLGFVGWFRSPVTRAAMAAYIALVMVFFHFMLAPLYDFEGLLAIGNVLLHYVCPILYLGWWLAFAPHGALHYRDIPVMLIPGLVYVIWVLIRGLWANEYPYAILDPTEGGYGGVAVGVSIIVAGIVIFGAILVTFDRAFAPKVRS